MLYIDKDVSVLIIDNGVQFTFERLENADSSDKYTIPASRQKLTPSTEMRDS